MTRKSATSVLAIAILCVSIIGASWWWWRVRTSDGKEQIRIEFPAKAPPMPSPEPQLYKDISPESALQANLALPFSNAPMEVAQPFFAVSDAATPLAARNATDCLASAIYYEAAHESLQGKRSVAQVVLNRTRHPAFPDSVCGVVYQGSERKTGCQFTFTCDGSLARPPARKGWEEARMIATQALNGYVEPSVGMATHYHADYVVPYWASSLNKIVGIGRHLFYGWKGTWGRRAAFSQHPRSDKDAPPFIGLDSSIFGTDPGLTPAEAASAPFAPYSPIIADGIKRIQPAPGIDAASPAQPLAADESGGSLIVDEQRPTLRADGP